MFHVECPNCHKWVIATCSCPPELAALPFHHPACAMNDIGATLNCGCCKLEHSHDAAGNACPGIDGGHAAAACPHPDPVVCPTHVSSTSPVAGTPVHLALASVDDPLECPGGHCGKGVKGCTVCRPVVISMLQGGAPITVSLSGA